MKILVTGGAGFIGSALVRHLISGTRHCVVNLDKLTYAGNLDSVAECDGSSRYVFEQADICDRSAMDRVFDAHKPDAVMHLAAESHVDRSIDGPGDFVHTNLVGTYTLLEAARMYLAGLDGASREAFRFLHVSTDEVYGDLHGKDDLFREDTSYAPSSPYAASKRALESTNIIKSCRRTLRIVVALERSANLVFKSPSSSHQISSASLLITQSAPNRVQASLAMRVT